MKLPIITGMALVVSFLVQPAHAEGDASGALSTLSEETALSAMATPVLISLTGACLAVGASDGLVKLVDGTGEKLSELTTEGFNILADSAVFSETSPRVTVNKKEIPLVVRNDYLQLNQKVETE